MKRITKNKKELTMSEYGARASVLTSDITINFLNKHQLRSEERRVGKECRL